MNVALSLSHSLPYVSQATMQISFACVIFMQHAPIHINMVSIDDCPTLSQINGTPSNMDNYWLVIFIKADREKSRPFDGMRHGKSICSDCIEGNDSQGKKHFMHIFSWPPERIFFALAQCIE